ncbi:hypothetical protein F5Y03DRAFT_405570 [Xylaria venustula]|nr:hypothetical protein F5Y03DRAFT_405570 [Xylaria venustula]
MHSDCAPNHTGVLPEELLVCRHLFGLGPSPLSDRWLGSQIHNCHLRDVLLVSVYVTGTGTSGISELKEGYQVGISTLDLRDFDARGTTNVIKSYQLQVWNRPDGKYIRHAYHPRDFQFGNTNLLDQRYVKTTLRKIISGRPYVVVSYNSTTDFEYMEHFNFEAQLLYNLEMSKVIQYHFQSVAPCSLAELLSTLQLPMQKMHVPGNRARSVLHILLLTLLKDWNCRSDRPTTSPSQETRETLSKLRLIPKIWPATEPEQPSLEQLFKKYQPELESLRTQNGFREEDPTTVDGHCKEDSAPEEQETISEKPPVAVRPKGFTMQRIPDRRRHTI